MVSTTPKARALGAELRQARERAGLGLRELARRLEMSHSVLSRIESGERPPRPEDVASILTALGVHGQAQESILDLSRDTGGSHWLSVGMPELDRQLAALLDFERTASHIIDVSPLLIPGLLQTSEYVRAMMTTAGLPSHEVEMRSAVRLGRREALRAGNPSRLTAYIGESALYQRIVDATAMREQLRFILELADLPHVTVRIIPAVSGWHPGLEGAFSLLEFTAAPPIVHLETRRSGLFLGEKADVDAYRVAIDKVREVALSPADSTKLIADASQEMETTS
ncbi:helix-turn-helix transcriptional regulator [Saccharomonospora sp.]|uniref:helix-turn-helix domain-containing protein n=1 Tax=Saccharomonospora sp. TaxID=33913 RepID=UPI002631E81C|nr:helix-turn-helix transcriptional regulator [Saccharomonospora sp.]